MYQLGSSRKNRVPSCQVGSTTVSLFTFDSKWNPYDVILCETLLNLGDESGVVEMTCALIICGEMEVQMMRGLA